MRLFCKKRKKNLQNSSMRVTCVASGKCQFRHTTMCYKCGNNIRKEEDKSYFESKM